MILYTEYSTYGHVEELKNSDPKELLVVEIISYP